MRTSRLAAGLLFLGLCLNTGAVLAQVGIGTVTPNTHALLELRNTGTPRGLMLPKVATSQRTTLAASLNTYHRGMLVADTTIGTGGLFVWDGAVWQLVQTGVPTPLVWDRSGGNAFLVNGTDNVGIGTNAPATKVEIRQATGFPILQIGESATQGGQLQWDATGNRFTIQTNSHADPITIGNNWLNLTTAGNVGIGIALPDGRLHVAGGHMRIDAGFFLSAGLTTDAFSYDGKTMGNYALGWFSDSWNGDGSTGWLSGWGGIKLFTLSQPRMSITAGGNVGIGTTAPPSLLSLGSNSFSASVGQADPVELLRFDNAFDNAGAHTTNRITLHNTGVWKAGIGINTGGVNYFSGDSHRFWVGHQDAVQGTQVMTVDLSGRVGIGTPTPLQTLHVQGGFQLQNGSQAAGRVLTSDASGVASWQAIPAGLTGTGTVDKVAVWNGAAAMFAPSNLHWDNVASRLGIGTTTPGQSLHVQGGFQLQNGSQAAGRVLTSDANGVATWQTPAGGLTGTGTVDKVAVWNGASAVYAPTNLHWDNVANRLGIGISAPATMLHLQRFGAPELRLDNSNYVVNELATLRFMHGTVSAYIQSLVPGGNDVDLRFFTTDNNTAPVQRMTITGNGTVGIGAMTTAQHNLTVGENSADGQVVTLRGYSNIGNWKGGAAFGYTGASVIMGQLNGVAQIGGHNATLGGWLPLYINSGGGDIAVGTGTLAPEGAMDIYRSSEAQTAWNAGGFIPYGTERADLVLTRRHGPIIAELGYSNNLIDFRSHNGSAEATIAQILTTVDPNGGGGFSGGLAFATSPGGAVDPAGRRLSGNVPTVRMWINHLGNVGIGNTAPSTRLHVTGGFRLENGSQAAGRVLTSDANGVATWQAPAGGTASNGLTKVADDYRLGGTLTQNTSIANALKNFEITGYTEPVIDVNQPTSGVGAGGSDNTAYWQSWTVVGNGTMTQIGVEFFTNFGQTFTLTIYSGTGTGGAVVGTASGIKDGLGIAYLATPIPVTAGQIYTMQIGNGSGARYGFGSGTYAAGQSSFNSGNADMTFKTYISQVTSPLFVGGATGRVGINTTVPDVTLAVNGNASKTGGGSWATFSDARLKDVHGTFNRGLKELMQLQPIVYSYNGRNGVNTEDGKHHTGFLAQEVQRVLPEAVTTSASGYLVLNQDPILWTMLNAIKEQQAQISALQQQLEASRTDVSTRSSVDKHLDDLRSENADLRARLERLEALLGTEAKR